MTRKRTAVAASAHDKLRLDRFFSEVLDGLSRSRAKALIKAGAATCDGESVSDPRASVESGREYTLTLPDPVPATPEPEAIALDILHEDDDLVVINKPAGMAVHPAPGSWSGTLVNALLHHCEGRLPGIGGVERPGIVHRIDKDTTGVMVVAKSEAAHAGLSDLFASHMIDRAYLALTRGAPRPLTGSVDAAIARATGDRKKMSVVRGREDREGRHAVTHYRTLDQYGTLDKGAGLPAAALIECRLETGRTHQIRVHMAHIGAPLIGDPVYARHRGIKAFGAGEAFIAATGAARAMRRQALHAARLGFVHPVTGEEMAFEARLPDDMEKLRVALAAMTRA
ncbi:MAG: RluA family pseudouridine synthase [Alphaproteobacteria bacterium]|jgi:23S rRNA pseudouridine1911/1915/1917 synthase|nr:RluA family pseudouridine synthase [Alphaproteobacteria bacterium]